MSRLAFLATGGVLRRDVTTGAFLRRWLPPDADLLNAPKTRETRTASGPRVCRDELLRFMGAEDLIV